MSLALPSNPHYQQFENTTLLGQRQEGRDKGQAGTRARRASCPFPLRLAYTSDLFTPLPARGTETADELNVGKRATKLHRAFVCCERLLAIHALPPVEEHVNPCLPAVRSEERSERLTCYSQTPYIHEFVFPSVRELRPPLVGRVNLSVLHQLSATEGAGKRRPALPRRYSVVERD